jgi:ferredoxin
VSPVRYELGIYIPEDDILHNHRHGNLKSDIHHAAEIAHEILCFASRSCDSCDVTVKSPISP